MSNSKIIIFGGDDDNYHENKKIFIFDNNYKTWSKLDIDYISGNCKCLTLNKNTILLVLEHSSNIIIFDINKKLFFDKYHPIFQKYQATIHNKNNNDTIFDRLCIRYSESSVLLNNGKLLIIGGQQREFTFSHEPSKIIVHKNYEIYTPSSLSYDVEKYNGKWKIGYMNKQRIASACVLLKNNLVLIIGGENESSCEYFNPESETFSDAGSTLEPRYNHTATVLLNGDVLVTGGFNDGKCLKSCEIFSNNEWKYVADMNINRTEHSAALLEDGNVLICSGCDVLFPITSCEIYNPILNKWSFTSDIPLGLFGHSSTTN